MLDNNPKMKASNRLQRLSVVASYVYSTPAMETKRKRISRCEWV